MSSSSSYKEHALAQHIRTFGSVSFLPCQHCHISEQPCYRLSERSSRCAGCALMSTSCKSLSWTTLDRQQADLESRIRKEEVKEDRAYQKALEHRARLKRLRKTLELSRSRAKAKTIEDFDKQTVEIEKRIAEVGYTESEEEDARVVEQAERDMDAFLAAPLVVAGEASSTQGS